MLSNPIVLTVIVTTLLIGLLIAVVIITMFASNKKNVQQEMKMAQMQLDYEKGQREVQEQVMITVARELHDNVGQKLTFMNLQLQQQKAMNVALAQSLQPVSEMMIETIEEVRVLGRSLNSEQIAKNGLLYTIEKEADRLRLLKKFTVHWEHDKEPELTKDQKVIVFRIFQEMLNNLLKHSDAKNIYLSLRGEGKFKLVVKDDGKGFDAEEIMKTAKGAGLKNIMKRAELAGLKCELNTKPEARGGSGTTFTLEVE
jgi:signal transduction histidine kinase